MIYLEVYVDHAFHEHMQTLWHCSIPVYETSEDFIEFLYSGINTINVFDSDPELLDDYVHCRWFKHISYIISYKSERELLSTYEGRMAPCVTYREDSSDSYIKELKSKKHITHNGLTSYLNSHTAISSWTLRDLEKVLCSLKVSEDQLGDNLVTAIRLLGACENGRIILFTGNEPVNDF